MNKDYGCRITIFQAASIYEYNLGFRDYMDYKDAMLTNSLFKEYLDSIGMKVSGGNSTRDIICLDFGYGSKSFERKVKAEKNKELKAQLKAKAEEYDKTKEELRIEYYVNGVDVAQPNFNRKGEVEALERIHYKMLYRSTNKAKTGKVMFIRDELYDSASEYLRMGIELPKENAPIVELGAYESLIASTIVGKVQIDPKDILVLKDYDSFMKTNVISIETDKDKHCYAVRKSDYELANTMFDGQALIDSSIFPDWGDGYILLREHFCKMAAFCTHIQKFFKDHYGDEYDTAVINDMQGNPHRVKDIKLITTNNAMKWLKLGVSYDYWCEQVNKNDNQFGIVKTSHRSKLGDNQVMSYQMVNSLDIDTINESMTATKEYILSLKYNDEFFLQYLKDNSNFSNDFEVLIALVEHDPDFIRSSYFKERRHRVIMNYIKYVRMGKLIQNGDNLTIVANPYGMLMYTVGLNPEDDPTFESEPDATQVYTGRFDDDVYLAAFRSPYNSRNNMNYLHNHYHEYFTKYFDLGKQIIAANMIHTDWQARNNGSDTDSDSVYTTDSEPIVNHAKFCYTNYPTIVNNIPHEKKHYNSSLLSFAEVDNRLAASQLSIGESSNLAQICLSYSYNTELLKGVSAEQCYMNVCILSVIAQIAIDSSKRSFDIDVMNEIKRIKEEMRIGLNKYPMFWKLIKEKNELRRLDGSKRRAKIQQRNENKDALYQLKQTMAEEGLKYTDLNEDEQKLLKKVDIYNPRIKCPMNAVSEMTINDRVSTNTKIIPIAKFLIRYPMDSDYKRCKKVEELIEKFNLQLHIYNKTTGMNNRLDDDQNILLNEKFDEMINEIQRLYISNSYLGLMSMLIDKAFQISRKTDSKMCKNRALLLKVLYKTNKDAFLKCFSGNLKAKEE